VTVKSCNRFELVNSRHYQTNMHFVVIMENVDLLNEVFDYHSDALVTKQLCCRKVCQSSFCRKVCQTSFCRKLCQTSFCRKVCQTSFCRKMGFSCAATMSD